MARNLAGNYPNVVAADANYPSGSFKNDSTGSAGDGTPVDKAWLNDWLGFFQATLSAAGVVPSGAADTAQSSQYLTALRSLMWSPGDVKPCSYSTPETGWLEAAGGTIGNASSGATVRANADTLALFTKYWSEPSTVRKLYTSAGAEVARGASAAADFAANCRIDIPDYRGTVLRGWDHGRGFDADRVNGSYQADQIKAHTHTFLGMDNGDTIFPVTGPEAGGGAQMATYTTSSTGGTENTVKNTAVMYVIKL